MRINHYSDMYWAKFYCNLVRKRMWLWRKSYDQEKRLIRKQKKIGINKYELNTILKQKKKKKKAMQWFFIYFEFFCNEGASLLQLEKSTISTYIRQQYLLSFSLIKTDSFSKFPPLSRTSVMKPYLRFLLTYKYVSCKKSL